MYTLKGKYNSANIMLPEGYFADETTTSQIYDFLNHPAFQGIYISLMPDLHAGAGSCIGFTSTMNNYIIPNIVGVDIGCGVLTTKLDTYPDKIDLDALEEFIKENIPAGFSVNDTPAWNVSGNGLKYYTDIIRISRNIDSNRARNLRAIGSLGGGNHFIEIGVDKDNFPWLTVHTGSRKFGLDVAKYHQQRAKEYLKNNFVKEIKSGLEFLYQDNKYLDDMDVAQWFAKENRQRISDRIIKFLDVHKLMRIESVHNYIDLDNNIIRKGAVSAQKDELLVIPFNMEDGLIIGKGKGSKKWNYSAPHGAGRIMSRKKAKEELSLKEAQDSMKEKGIFTKNIPLDEVKSAYKDKDLIISAIDETVEIIDYIKPIYNFKA